MVLAIGSMMNPVSLYLHDITPLISCPTRCSNYELVFRSLGRLADTIANIVINCFENNHIHFNHSLIFFEMYFILKKNLHKIMEMIFLYHCRLVLMEKSWNIIIISILNFKSDYIHFSNRNLMNVKYTVIKLSQTYQKIKINTL